ncbi:methyltransferase-like protein 17, mitochondrial [Diplogelasinospora grovesii]|uniref:Methyltransferase-like protein 17, mitochondrial n=1 Tax=Diplogelasinospora grovesii TaxID=303347 RepID=A0AAN6NI00_9PEZI|nr:methyltransferase-like protein 17, mitochondrial [Diplogelasinospora grovesii]
MISAGKLHNRCPACRTHLVSLFESRFSSSLPRTRTAQSLRQSSSRAAASSTRSQPDSIRRFSSTRVVFQETHNTIKDESRAGDAELRAEDSETIVRQARQTFGNTLPPGYLSAEEYKLYERLYGPPLRETRPEDVGIPYHGESGEVVDSTLKNALFRETEHGELEEVEYKIKRLAPAETGAPETTGNDRALEHAEPLTEAQIDYLSITANNQREYNALIRLQRDFEAASLRPLEEEEEEEEQGIEAEEGREEADDVEEQEQEQEQQQQQQQQQPDGAFAEQESEGSGRLHAHTVMGWFRTSPSTLHLPRQQFIEPISTLLGRTDPTHVAQAAEKAFGGPGLPFSPATPESKKHLPMKPVAMQAGHHRMTEIDADAYIATVLPGMYASVMSTLVEVRKRLGAGWLRGLLARGEGQGPRVLDVGAGGAGLAAWQQVLQAEWDVLRDKGEVKGRGPPGKKTVVVGSEQLRHRISRFLQNTTFLPRLPDYLHSVEGAERQLDSDNVAPPRKTFDVIIASHLLMPLDKPYKRKALLDNLWTMLSPEGGVLIVMEKGHPRGFEAVADVRARLLDEFIIPPTPPAEPQPEIQAEAESERARAREPGMIIAPCTNHTKCPMYLTPGLSSGRKDFCHFEQRFIRPPFLQRVLGASHRNHEDIKFSYVAVRRGTHPDGHVSSSSSSSSAAVFVQGQDATDQAFAGYEKLHGDGSAAKQPHPLSLPRNVLPPLKRRGHVTMDLCTPAGAIERWTVPKSFSKQAYHDARKTRWGDLWALGAKTRIRRDVRLGRPQDATTARDGRSQKTSSSGSRKRPTVVELSVDPQHGLVGAQEKFPKGRIPVERRTKGGKKVRIRDLMEEMGIDEIEDDEDDARPR